VGHDLRNPLASIQGGTELSITRSLAQRSEEIVGMMRNSPARMSDLSTICLILDEGPSLVHLK
jgi:sigma-B regulation protein RsbU (phosphoserine phosphatase)